MIAPLFKQIVVSIEFQYFLAILIGIAFGYILERAGFGNARKIAAEFYFEDFTMLKVFFAAMVTGAVGILFFNWFGWLDISKIFIPRTFIWGQMLGGAILGAGFGFGGYCPGTSLVSASTGKLDGMAFVFGAFLGTMSFGDIFYDWLKGAYLGGAMGRITLPELFGINAGVFVLLIIIMALGVFWLVEKTERDWDPYRKFRKGPKQIIDR